jgi:hypothetical protein
MTEDPLILKDTVVLQSCTMSEEGQLDSRNETSVTSPDSAHDIIIMNCEEGIGVNQLPVGVNTYGQLIPMPISFPAIMAAQDQVSHMSLHPFLDIFPRYSEMPTVLCCLHLSFCPTTPLWWMKISFVFVLCESITRKFVSKYLFIPDHQN